MNVAHTETGQGALSGRFEWEAAYARLEAVQRKIDGGSHVSADDAAQILQRRAEAVARPRQVERASAYLALVTFSIAGQQYALEARHVEGVIRADNITRLPSGAGAIAGVIARRGRMIAVFDPSVWFCQSATTTSGAAQIVVISKDSLQFGFVVAGDVGFTTISMDGLLPSPAAKPGTAAAFVSGVTANLVRMIDVDAMVQSGWLVIDERGG
jgi:purine-binding chemotaxis protein CheW